METMKRLCNTKQSSFARSSLRRPPPLLWPDEEEEFWFIAAELRLLLLSLLLLPTLILLPLDIGGEMLLLGWGTDIQLGFTSIKESYTKGTDGND